MSNLQFEWTFSSHMEIHSFSSLSELLLCLLLCRKKERKRGIIFCRINRIVLHSTWKNLSLSLSLSFFRVLCLSFAWIEKAAHCCNKKSGFQGTEYMSTHRISSLHDDEERERERERELFNYTNGSSKQVINWNEDRCTILFIGHSCKICIQPKHHHHHHHFSPSIMLFTDSISNWNH